MKKFNSLSYRTKKRRINAELQSHFSIFSSLEGSFTINNSNNNTSGEQITENLVPNNCELLPENNISTNNAYLNIQESPALIPESSNNHSDSESYPNIDSLLDDNLTFDTEKSEEKSFKCELAEWTIKNKIAHTALNSLLLILKKHKCFSSLPKDARTILHTKPIDVCKIRDVNPGKYYHFGIENGIIRSFSNHDERVQQLDEIKLVIGIDGLPISRSSSNQFWPILAYVRSKFNIVFLVGLYFGTEKPMDSNDFIKDFVNEATHLVSNGIIIKNYAYKVVIDVFCCDTPAKAFILKIKGHNGFSSCTRCEIEGEYKENRLCFPYSDVSNREVKRTHDNYLNRTDTNHHSSVTSISSVVDISGVNVVSSFSLDYMHLVTLGVMKKLILLWMKGPLNVRLPSSKIKQISNLLLSFRSKFPCEFSRKPRALEEVLRWKATEFRSFLLYIGPLVLKSIVSKDCFKNFMALNIAMTILLSPNLGSLIQYADDLLNYFVLTFEQIYGQYLMSSNIHGLIHLIDDYKQYGPLDNCSAFPFENYMKVLKNMLRQPNKPLEQVVKRFSECDNFNLNLNDTHQSDNSLLIGPHNNGPLLVGCVNPQFNTLVLDNYKIKCKVDADSYFSSKTNDIIKLINIAHSNVTGSIVLIGRKFESKELFYDKPIQSSYFGIYTVKNLSKNLSTWTINDIQRKVMLLSMNSISIAIPLLHSS